MVHPNSLLRDLPELNDSESRQLVRRAAKLSEKALLAELLPMARLSPVVEAGVWQEANTLVELIREKQRGQGGIDALLQEFSLSSEEGVALMCLAEALLRIPDGDTQDRMINDRLSGGDWSSHLGQSDSLFVNASAWGLLLTGKVARLSTQRGSSLLGKSISRLGEPVIRSAMRTAMEIMGSQFVMGESIESALNRARHWEKQGYTYSYDMLGEGARTMADADRYFEQYRDAINAIGKSGGDQAGISIKLSALHPRYELKHPEALEALADRLLALAQLARSFNLPLTVDAEESWRLDLSLDIIERVFKDSSLSGYDGFGLAVQAYQKAGYAVVRWAVDLARAVGRRLCVRLVKGAYWDTEIKWAQERGYPGYPVFSEKCGTDLSYQVCARHLMANRDLVYPQFATHNAYTLAAVRTFERGSDIQGGYEFQRLHGMGEELYDDLVESGTACRIYAPVGEHEDLLAYLVRRLLENGANTSFVNNIQNRGIPISQLLEDPVKQVERIRYGIPLPADIFLPHRENSAGLNLDDLTVLQELSSHLTNANVDIDQESVWPIVNPARPNEVVGAVQPDSKDTMLQKLAQVSDGAAAWAAADISIRAECLLQFADRLEEKQADYIALCIQEAGKTLDDAVAELREAVDFCRYYAREAELLTAPPLGTVLCISPWNFPLAIFAGQATAALVAGNTVLAKPAEQTSMIAARAIDDLYVCGVPESVLQLVIAEGPPISQHLVSDPRIGGVMFTGSNEAAQQIAAALNRRAAEEPAVLVAETGGMNAMVVDSTALAEQVVDDVVQSAFHSAGQRCSAMRLLYLQEEIADDVIEKVVGKMQELKVNDPASFSTDIGPVIDQQALSRLRHHVERLKASEARLLFECDVPTQGYFFPPILFELPTTDLLTEEVFGPVLHIRRFKGGELEKVVDEINSTGFGLTMGMHSRIESRVDRMAELVRAGNIYVNRNMVGAVVGVQPFGGRGLSGTGPKAGGPFYLQRLTRELPVPASKDDTKLPPIDSRKGEADKIDTAVQRHWQELAITDRVRQVRMLLLEFLAANPALDSDRLLQAFAQHCDWFQQYEEDQGRPVLPLPAPTGESDQLYLEAHGTVGVVVGIDIEQSLLQALIAMVAGNSVVMIGGPFSDPSSQRLVLSGVFADVLRYTVTLDLSLDAFALPSASSLYTNFYHHYLDSQAGLPVLIVGHAEPLAFLWEKTVCINTTAAGGNASLMAGSR